MIMIRSYKLTCDNLLIKKHYRSQNKRETKKVLGSMLTTANYKDRVEASRPKPKKKKRVRRKAKK